MGKLCSRKKDIWIRVHQNKPSDYKTIEQKEAIDAAKKAAEAGN